MTLTERLRIVVGSDDAGFEYKEALRRDLEASDLVASVVDVGVPTLPPPDATVHEIVTPATALPCRSVTCTTSGEPRRCPAGAC